MKELTGKDLPFSKIGAGAVRDALLKAAGLTKEGKAVVEYEGEIRTWLKSLEAKPTGELPKYATKKVTFQKQLKPEEIEAIENTEGAVLDKNGLSLDVVRYQKPEQAGELSIREGVFFLPEKKSPYKKYYTTGKIGYGGSERLEGRTTYRNPYMVKASSGGRAPKLVYNFINGKGAYEKMRSDVLRNAWTKGFIHRPDYNGVSNLLEKYGGNSDLTDAIIEVSTKGNTLPYAIQEHIVASSVRKAGYDAVIGYNKIGGKIRLSEVFDVRPSRYPSKITWEHYFEDFYGQEKPKPTDVVYATKEVKPQKAIWKEILKEEKLNLPEGEIGDFILNYARIADPDLFISTSEIKTIAIDLNSKIKKTIGRLETGEIEVESPPAMIEDLKSASKGLTEEIRNKDANNRAGLIVEIDNIVSISHRVDSNILPVIFDLGDGITDRWAVIKDIDNILDYLASSKVRTSKDFIDKFYATKQSISDSNITISQVRDLFKPLHSGLTQDDNVWVKLRGGYGFQVKNVQSIAENELAFEIGRGRMKTDGELIAGKFEDDTIEIVKGIGDRWTLTEEGIHMSEKAGLIRSDEVSALTRKIKWLARAGKFETQNKNDIGGFEDRAKFIIEGLHKRATYTGTTQKILNKIADFIDSLVNLFKATSRGVTRAFESGEIFQREAETSGINQFAQDVSFSLKKAIANIRDNPKFNKWFKKSQVVDKNDNPLPVYHGTKAIIDKFKHDEKRFDDRLIFFSKDPAFAEEWARGRQPNKPSRNYSWTDQDQKNLDKHWKDFHKISDELYKTDKVKWTEKYDKLRATEPRTRYTEEREADVSIYPVYISAQNIFNPMKDYKVVEPLLKTMEGMQGVIEKGLHKEGNWIVYERKDVIDLLESKGYDGIYIKESAFSGAPHDTIAVWEPTQIKSIFNTGAYGLDEPDIMYAVAGKPTKKLTVAEKMLGLRKPKEKDIIETYKEKHIAFEPKKLSLTKENAKDFIAKTYTKFVFKEYPAIRLAEKSKDPKAIQRVQDQINRVWGKGGIVEVFVAGKGPHRLDVEGKPVYIENTQSLKEIVKDLNPQEYEDYETLRIAERDVALARFRPDITGTDIEASTQVINALERKYGDKIKKLRDTSKAQRKYDDILLQLLVEEGWLSNRIYETIKARPEAEFYASFLREMESVGEQVFGGKDPLKKIRGSELRKIPTIESSISNTYKTIKLLETIKLNKEIVNLRNLTPDLTEVIKEVKPHYIPVKQTLEAEVDPKMRGELDEVTKGLGATVETLKKVGRGKLGRFIHEMRGLGLTDEESNRIELKFATTEKTYAHELGHLIDRKFDLQTLLIKGRGEEYATIKKELRKIADQRAADDSSAYYKKYIRKRTEQVAEFVSRYLTQPDQARKLAPAAVKKLEEFFNSKPQLRKLLTIRPSGQAILAKMSDVLFAKSPIPPKNTIIVPVNGMKHYWQIPADVHKAIDYYSPQEMSMVIKILSGPARLLRAGATLSAEFIMRNPIRDQFTAMVYSKYGYIPFWDLGRGFFELMKKGDLYQEFKAGGGEQAYFTSMDRTTLNMTTKDIVGFRKGLKTYNPIEYLRIASEAMEKATRLGLYKRARAKGATVPEATAAARESTLDFRRIGEERRINQIIAFWNANVQGIDIMRRKIHKYPGRTLLRLTMGITLPSIALWLYNNSDDDRKERYNALPGWRKNFFWNIIIEDMPVISLPKPFELGLIFGSLPERILDYIALNDPKELKTIAQSIKDGTMPGLIPTAALPILENMTNWSFFMERPIESETIKRLPPGQRAHQYTSIALKKFGKAMDISPIKMENWVRGWTGGLGKFGLDIIDPLFKTDEIPEVTKHWYEVTPGLKGFIGKEFVGGKDITNFYDNLEKITQAEQGFNLLFKTDKEEADKFNKKTNGIKRFATSFRKTSLKIGKLRKRKSVIMESKQYTSDRKRELVDEIDKKMTVIARLRNETLLKPIGRQLIPGMVSWESKEKPIWQESVFGKKLPWQKTTF
ncbi:MAG: LPD38 domain-containing protein [bacterium]|nr:LPD38 domain-containing protein [bacterium]